MMNLLLFIIALHFVVLQAEDQQPERVRLKYQYPLVYETFCLSIG